MNRNGKSHDVKFDITLTDEQKLAKQNILSDNIAFSFLVGSAGTSKTFTASAIALDLLFKKEVNKIVITRPTVGTEDIGFLPGTLEEKLEPWLVPIRDNIRKIYNKPDKITKMEADGQLEIVPLSFFRGRSFQNAVCIIDEMQNLTKSQLKMALGRLGKESIMIFCGDYDQIDLKNKSDSAIHEIEKLRDCPYVYIQTMVENHRHPAVKEVLNILK